MSIEDRKLAFDNAALTLHLNAVILEKDFWVSWLLRLLFAQPELAPFLVFKGGTSLSKLTLFFGKLAWMNGVKVPATKLGWQRTTATGLTTSPVGSWTKS